MLNKNMVDYDNGDHPKIMSKRKTKLSVGFEWEIPINIDEVPFDGIDYENDMWDELEYAPNAYLNLSTSFLSEAFDFGYRYHVECGGLEVASPVFSSIATARSHAKSLVNDVRKIPTLISSGYAGNGSECGIHIHIGGEFRKTHLFEMIEKMLHRYSSADFLFQFSGRRRGHSYEYNATSCGWDHLDKLQRNAVRAFTGAMLRYNSGTDCTWATLEFRLWTGKEEKLLPAIDFAHSVVKYCKLMEDLGRNSVNNPPYLGQWKTWLMKQKGYQHLKKEKSLELLEAK